MKEIIFNIIQITLAALLTLLILLQNKGSGLSEVFGGSGNVYSTKRGIDKIFHYSTIIIGLLFFSISLVRLISF
jgi:protein translocase SecG subunit